MTYILLLRNASGIHIYYQYYLALPVTFGLVLILDMIADKQDAIKRNRVWVLSLSLLFVFIAGYTVYQYDEFFSHMVGDVSDIQLLKSLRQIPTNKTVVVADADSWDEAWFQNPNIEYYTGRSDIQAYLIQDQGVPYADYMLARPEYTGQVVDFINGEGYGANVSATKEKCSTGLCPIHLIKSSK